MIFYLNRIEFHRNEILRSSIEQDLLRTSTQVLFVISHRNNRN